MEFFGLLLLLAVFGEGSKFFLVFVAFPAEVEAEAVGLSTFSGVKAGGAVGLRCRLPRLVVFSLPSLKPMK